MIRVCGGYARWGVCRRGCEQDKRRYNKLEFPTGLIGFYTDDGGRGRGKKAERQVGKR